MDFIWNSGNQERSRSGKAAAHGKLMRQFFEQGVTLAFEPAGGPMAHVHVEAVAAEVAGPVQHFLEMFVARVKVQRAGREPTGKTFGQICLEKTFRVLDHALGNGLGPEQGVAFQLGGQGIAPRAKFAAKPGLPAVSASGCATAIRVTARPRRGRFLRA